MNAETAIAPDAATGPLAPYPGLRPFRDSEASIFFGRERQCDMLLDLLEDRRLLLIHGSSGCGKSSLVAAGLLPLLGRDYRRAGQLLRDASFRPSWGPYEGLARALAETIGAPATDGDADGDSYGYWGERLLHDDTIVAEIEARLDEIEVSGLCLVVDQFEEIFAWQRDRRASDVERLVSFLGAVHKKNSERIFILLTMRSDFIGACGRFPGLTKIINDCQYLLPTLDVDEIARAIVKPARMFGGDVEPALLEALLRVASDGLDPLPVVQHALKRMVDGAPRPVGERWVITLDDLTQVSGKSNPLSTHADEIAASIEANEPDGAAALEWIFRSLLDIEKSGEAVRRPRDFEQLVKVVVSAEGRGAELTERIVGAFAAEGANLLVVSRSKQRRVDISHEALLRQWTRIAEGSDTPSWKRREIEDGLMWRGFATELRGKDPLSARSRKAAREFFSRMRAAPERARRYLTEQADIKDVTRSREWQRIEELISRALRRRALVTLIAAGAGLAVATSAVITLIDAAREAKRSATAAGTTAAVQTISSETSEASLGSERIDAPAAQILDAVADRNFDRSGYIWIGDARGSVATLQTLNGAKVAPQSIREGQCYSPRYLLALRSGLPDPLNRSAQRVGTVSVGQRVCALEGPKPSPSGDQRWLQVSTVTVYIHVNSPASVALDRIERQLREYHYFLPGTELLRIAAGLFEVRYCNQGDQEAGQTLATYLTQQLSGPVFEPKLIVNNQNCALAASGTLEVWIDTASLDPSDRIGPPSRIAEDIQ